MASSFIGTGWTPSSRSRPCPICTREHDGACSIGLGENGDLLIHCHMGANYYPPDMRKGETMVGHDGQTWAYVKENDDGRTKTFKLHTELKTDRATSRKVVTGPWKAKETSAPFQLALLPTNHDARHQNPLGPRYDYSPTQWTERLISEGGAKSVRPRHVDANGKTIHKKNDGWPLFGEDLLTHVGDKWPLFLEGEKCAVVARNGGAVGLSFIGSANAAEIQAGIRRLVAAHVAGVVYVADHDDTGRKKAAKFEQTCNEGGLKVVVLHAADVWPGLPAKGSIDDVDDTPENIVRTISAAAEKAAMVPLAVVPKDGKRKRMAPDEVMERIPTIMGELRQDVRSGDIEANGTIVGRNTIGRLYLELSSPSEQWPKETTADAVLLLASQNQFDPVVDYLNGLEADALPMDQWGRLDRHLLGITDPVAGAFLPRYFVAAVARAFEPGCDMRQLPVLVGPQWRGKSALGKILFGAKHWVEGIGNLDKDALMRIHTSWGVELAELDGVTRRADLDSLKAFISETSDLYRKPYDRAPENHHRRFVFWGTANRSPLRDTTGNTRFVCIKLPDRMLPLDWAVEHRDSIWARAVAEYRAGKQWSSCSEEERKAINDRNKDHQEEDPWEEKIANFLAIPRPYVYLDDLLEMLEIPIERRHGGAGRRVAGIVEAIGWERDRRQHGPDRIRAFWPPRPKYNRTIPIDEII